MSERLSDDRRNRVQLRFADQPILLEGDIEWDRGRLEDLAETVTAMDVDEGFDELFIGLAAQAAVAVA